MVDYDSLKRNLRGLAKSECTRVYYLAGGSSMRPGKQIGSENYSFSLYTVSGSPAVVSVITD